MTIEQELFQPYTAIGILSILAVLLALFAGAWHGFLRQLIRERRRAQKEVENLKEQVTEEVSAKNLSKMGGIFASDYIKNWIDNLDNDLKNTQAQIDQVQRTGQVTEETQKQLKLLQGKMKQIKWAIDNKETLMSLNTQFIPAVVQKVAMKVLGGLL